MMDYIKRQFSSTESQNDNTISLSTSESNLMSYIDISNSELINQESISKKKSKLLFVIDDQDIDW
jgi:hypothetical protein